MNPPWGSHDQNAEGKRVESWRECPDPVAGVGAGGRKKAPQREGAREEVDWKVVGETQCSYLSNASQTGGAHLSDRQRRRVQGRPMARQRFNKRFQKNIEMIKGFRADIAPWGGRLNRSKACRTKKFCNNGQRLEGRTECREEGDSLRHVVVQSSRGTSQNCVMRGRN